MTIYIKRKTLVKALEFLSIKTTKRTCLQEYVNGVHFKPSSDGLILTVSDFTSWVSCNISDVHVIDEMPEFLVNRDDVKALVNSTTEDCLSIELIPPALFDDIEPNRVKPYILAIGKNRTTALVDEDANSFYEHLTEPMITTFRGRHGDMIEALKRAKHAVSKDDSRPILNCVHLIPKDDNPIYVLEATDSYRLFTGWLPAAVGGYVREEVTIPFYQTFDFLNRVNKSRCGTNQPVTVSVSEREVAITTNNDTMDCTIITARTEGKYPNIKTIYDNLRAENPSEIQLSNTKPIIEWLKNAKRSVGNKALRMYPLEIITDGEDALYLTVNKQDGFSINTTIRALASELIDRIGVNIAYLLDALEASEGNVKLLIRKPNQPLELLSCDGTKELIMPVRL